MRDGTLQYPGNNRFRAAGGRKSRCHMVTFAHLTGSRRLFARRINHLEPPQGFAELPGIDLAQEDPREIGGQESDSLGRYRQRD
jgi:hypothetical protein